MKLYIDTHDNKKTVVGLDGDIIEKVTGPDKSQPVLSLIDQTIKKHHKNLSDITEIEVETGPGSFTGLKVGVAIANALGWSLNIPVNGKKFVEPLYEGKK